MVKQTVKQRRRVRSKKDTGRIKRKLTKQRKLRQRKKERSHKKVDDLSELLAQTTTSGIPPMEAATSQTDTHMSGADSGSMPVQQLHSSEQQLSRRELQSRLKAKLAGINLDRTAGLEKGIGDSRGLKKRPPRRGKMNIG